MYKSKYKLVFFFLFFLLFVKTDYRFVNSIGCCGDDYDYYAHAETIAIDFDFDYSNQIPEYSKFYFTNEEKVAPVGFSGSGILAAPFLFIGSIFDKVFNTPNSIFNFKVMLYSFSSIFYLVISSILLTSSIKKIGRSVNRMQILLLISGSGVAYYALGRYSMTHVYEVFVNTLIILFSVNILKGKTKDNISFFLLPFSLFLGLLIKLSNFYIFIIPFFIKEILNIKIKDIVLNIKNKLYFLSGFLLSMIFYIIINLKIYGKIIFNPGETYSQESRALDYISSFTNISDSIMQILNTMRIVLFSQEFGILWFSPSVFIIFVYILIFLYRKKYLPFLYLSIIFFFNIAIVNLWQSAGSSYGFRYLFSLIPIGIFIIFAIKFKYHSNLFKYYLIPFSIFGLFSIFIFESTEFVQLATVDIVNSFGKEIRYVQPEYLSGVFKSIFIPDAYLKLFATSFIGAIIFKLFILFFGVEQFFVILGSFGLPISNSDFLNLIEKLGTINIFQFLMFIILLYLTTVIISKKN